MNDAAARATMDALDRAQISIRHAIGGYDNYKREMSDHARILELAVAVQGIHLAVLKLVQEAIK